MAAGMSGILSAAPGPSAIRLMVGTHLLLMIQAALVLWTPTHLNTVLRTLVTLVLVIAISALGVAIHGLSDDQHPNWWRRSHGR